MPRLRNEKGSIQLKDIITCKEGNFREMKRKFTFEMKDIKGPRTYFQCTQRTMPPAFSPLEYLNARCYSPSCSLNGFAVPPSVSLFGSVASYPSYLIYANKSRNSYDSLQAKTQRSWRSGWPLLGRAVCITHACKNSRGCSWGALSVCRSLSLRPPPPITASVL